MERLRELVGGARLRIVAVIGMGGLVLCLLLVGGAYAAFFSGGFGMPEPTDDTVGSDPALPSPQPMQASPSPVATLSPTETALTPTATPTASSTATPTRRPPTSTAVPPTATHTEAPQADFRCFLSHMGESASGEQMFNTEYGNYGEGPAEGVFQVTWRLIGSDGPVQEDSWEYEGIPAGDTLGRFFDVSVPTGTWTMRLSVDSTDAIPESDENNNVCEITFVVSPPITLVPATLSP